jgi:hypothetical protein
MRALSYAVMALFVAGGVVAARYRQRFKWAAIGLYGIGVAAALLWVAVWLAGE